jgi:hypothetical protein
MGRWPRTKEAMELRVVIEKLQDETVASQQSHQDTLTQKNDAAT